jgi:phage shock protein PspC (stress-responsive transcriptional regulator)
MSEHTAPNAPTTDLKRLERSSQNRMIAGVCGGLGRYFDINPTVFRLGIVVLTLLGGAGVLVYIAAILVIPNEGEDASIAERTLAKRRDHPVQLVALAVVGIAIFALLDRAGTWPSAGGAWVLALIAGLVVLWASREPRPRWLVVVVATIALLFATVVAAVVTAFAWFNVSLSDGVGDRVYAPASIADVRDRYELGVGRLELDLSRLPTNEELHVDAHVGVGDLRVIVPRDAAVVVDSHVTVGDISALDRRDDGHNAHVVVGDGDKLFLNARVGAGEIDVSRAG